MTTTVQTQDIASLTARQRSMLAAIEAGRTTTRELAAAAGLKSNSNVARHLEALAAGGHIVLRRSARGITVATGRDFCQAWDAACRLAGNPDA